MSIDAKESASTPAQAEIRQGVTTSRKCWDGLAKAPQPTLPPDEASLIITTSVPCAADGPPP